MEDDNVNGYLLCKKCFKLIDEFESLQSRVNEIKTDLLTNFKNSSDRKQDDELIQEEIKPKEEICKDNEVPKKILDIPSSDDDTIGNPSSSAEKNSLQTIEDIEMELVKMHGGIDDNKEADNSANEEESMVVFNAGEMVDSEVVDDHSSDEDYDPNSSDNIVEAANNAEENSIKIKMEVNTDEGSSSGTSGVPNILRKKYITVNGGPSSSEEKKANEAMMNVPSVNRDGNLYTCMLCQGDETVAGEAQAIIQHLKTEHNTRLYICDICGQDFRKRNELSAHVDEHVATEEGDFQCEVCNRIFSNLRLFRIHRRMHYPQNKAWVCNTCGKKYSSKNLLEEHVNVHLGLRPYVCKMCGKDFASKYTAKAHEKTHEVRPRPYRCTHCSKTFLSHQNLAQHERTHTGLKEFSCHLCGKQFGSAHNLEVHSIVHTGYKPFSCGMCGKSFARKAEIRDHERTHTGERPYQCEFCGATFSQRSNLQSHKRATHYDDKRYRCDECGKGFKRRRLLDYHVKAVHTGERPFKCEVCETTFVYPEHFKKHRRIHTGEKPFLCEVCGKAFNSRDNRNAHRFVHSDKKPYECLVCGAGFMRKPLLYQHMQAQGHLNDTIVVNQPRLPTDEESQQLVAVNVDGGMEIVDASTTESKLYIADHNGEHIIINGQELKFVNEEDGNEIEADESNEDVGTVQADGEYDEVITSEVIANGETQIIETPDGPVQLVKVKIPNENGEEEEAWIKIVSEESTES